MCLVGREFIVLDAMSTVRQRQRIFVCTEAVFQPVTQQDTSVFVIKGGKRMAFRWPVLLTLMNAVKRSRTVQSELVATHHLALDLILRRCLIVEIQWFSASIYQEHLHVAFAPQVTTGTSEN